MSGVTVRVKVKLGNRAPRGEEAVAGVEPGRVLRAARLLALAYLIERLVESGDLKDYAEGARRLGITRARMTQLVNLLVLSPRIQEAILGGGLVVSERRLRGLLGEARWEKQEAVVLAKDDDP